MILHGAGVNAKNTDGVTVLMKAATAGNPLIIETLLSKGADVNAKDKDGRSVLDIAKMKKRDKAIMILQKHGANE